MSRRRWAALLGTDADGDAIALDGATLRFEPKTDARSGLCAVDLAGAARPPVTIAGVEFTIG